VSAFSRTDRVVGEAGLAAWAHSVSCARGVLALNHARYELRCGELPIDETLAALSAAEPNDAQAKMITLEVWVISVVTPNWMGVTTQMTNSLLKQRDGRAKNLKSEIYFSGMQKHPE
jgi:hypothetical protein